MFIKKVIFVTYLVTNNFFYLYKFSKYFQVIKNLLKLSLIYIKYINKKDLKLLYKYYTNNNIKFIYQKLYMIIFLTKIF